MLSKLFYYIGGNLLHKAAQKGDLPRMRKLIDKGADVNAVGPQKASPLYFAANSGSVEAAKLLLDHGADLHYTIPEGGSSLHSALLKQHLDLSLFLIDKGADIHKATTAGVTPLHLAALSGLTPALGRMLREGADIHTLTAQGQSAIYCALAGMSLRKSDDAACLSMLFASGADPRTGSTVVEDNFAGFSDAAKQALRKELENIAEKTRDEDLRQFALRTISAMAGKLLSAFVGELTQSDDPALNDWWYSEPVAVPFWDGRNIPFVYVFSPADDPGFIADADRATANVLKLTAEDRLAVTPYVEANCRASCEAAGLDSGEWIKPGETGAVWRGLTIPEYIQIQRRHRRDKDMYAQMGMDCEWEEEHGLQFVFRRGRKLTRVSIQDGWLTEADALGLDDSEDELLSRFHEKSSKK